MKGQVRSSISKAPDFINRVFLGDGIGEVTLVGTRADSGCECTPAKCLGRQGCLPHVIGDGCEIMKR